tara:strand:- start:35 stop:325 length:291 start_codon:yes stop_codon:yes gene_type:complete
LDFDKFWVCLIVGISGFFEIVTTLLNYHLTWNTSFDSVYTIFASLAFFAAVNGTLLAAVVSFLYALHTFLAINFAHLSFVFFLGHQMYHIIIQSNI